MQPRETFHALPYPPCGYKKKGTPSDWTLTTRLSQPTFGKEINCGQF